MAALTLGPAAHRAALHLALTHSYLREFNTPEARRHLIACDALCRTQRLARPLRLEVTLAFSVLTRMEGRFDEALWHATSLKRSQAPDRLLGAAHLAAATALRLSGQPVRSLVDLAAARQLAPGPEVRTAELLTWLQAEPTSVTEDVGALARHLPPALRSRLAWRLAEQGLLAARLQEAAAWCEAAEQDPVAREELIHTPHAAALRGWAPVVRGAEKPAVRVETIHRQGLHVQDDFLPVPGSGILLALLTYIIARGHVESRVLASDVLEPHPLPTQAVYLPGARSGSRAVTALSPTELEHKLNAQVRRHLATLRQLLADPTCVVTEDGVIFLDHRPWSSDALAPDASTPPGRPWLPRVPGSWAHELRGSLARAHHTPAVPPQ